MSAPRQPIVTHPLLVTWFEDIQSEGLARNTCMSYVTDLRELAAFLSDNLEGAVTDDLFTYRRSLLPRNLAVATRSRRITHIREFYDWLRLRQGKTASIAQDLHGPKRPESVHRWFTVDQIARLRRAFNEQETECTRVCETIGSQNPILDGFPSAYKHGQAQRKARTARNSVLRDRAMVEMGLMGLRVSEVIKLDVDDIRSLEYPDQATILVKRKGPKEQVLPLSTDARDALKRWLAKRPDVDTDAVFFRIPFHRSHPRLLYPSAEKIFKEHVQLAGLSLRRGDNFHILRHSTAQRLVDLGVPIQEVQALLGHRSLATTQIYFRVSAKGLRQTINILNYKSDGNEKGTLLTNPQEQA